MKVKTKYFGTIQGDELELLRIAGVIEDAAAYNLEEHHIKVHGDLIEEAKKIRSAIHEKESHRRLSSASQGKRQGRTGKAAADK